MTRSRAPAFQLRRAEEIARKLLAEYGLVEPMPIPVEDIAWDKGAEIVHGGLRGATARLTMLEERAVIRVADGSESAGRVRFSVAHELGHFLLHRARLPEFCQEVDFHAWQSSRPLEQEANVFATELLLPTEMVRPLCEVEEVDFAPARQLADRFDVSLTAAAIRFVTFCPAPCALAMSDSRHVRWSWPNPVWRGVLRRTGDSLHAQSLAARVLRQGLSLEEDSVGVDVWLDDAAELDFEIIEFVVKMPKLGVALSLLWGQESEDE